MILLIAVNRNLNIVYMTSPKSIYDTATDREASCYYIR